ncbi:NAC domain superfamily [Arabidopsis suecica]|uniref:NAC domain superfamily n=1 Tax=Arabidopsis suecica TaxID=45249 RepID=A0A8T2GYH4_ARASU|nr:NAC domain superfamily [Arabidopsis suecica]
MMNPVGFRFRPNDEEIVDHYLRPKNLDSDTSHVDEVISTVDICSFDPWDLPSKSMIKSRDGVWYFFSVKEMKYNRGDQQRRRTNSGFWKKTGKTMTVMRKRGNREKIGEKRVLVFKNRDGSKTDWVMHEYHATSLFPNQMMTYTVCKVEFKGEETEISSSSTGSEIEQIHSLIPLVNSSGGSEGSSFHSQELQNSSQSGVFANVQGESQIDDATTPIEEEWKTWLNNDGDEQRNIMFMQDHRSDYTPLKSLTGVFSDDSSDDNDSDLISPKTNSIGTSSTCASFASSNHQIDQTQHSPDSTVQLVSLTQEVSQGPGQVTVIREHKLGEESVKKKRASFVYRMIHRLVKKIHQCYSISRT